MKTLLRLFNKHAHKWPVLTAVMCLAGFNLAGQTVLVESRTSDTKNPVTPCPLYCESASGWYGPGSSSKSSASGTTPTRLGSRFAYSGTPSVTIQPTLQSNVTYRMDITHISVNCSPNIVIGISYAGCTGSATSTTAFQSSGANTWETVGTITVNSDTTQPQITFTYQSGTLASSNGRWYVDAIRFVSLADPCTTGLPELTTVNGPLVAGQTHVNVPGVSSNATAIKVYADGQVVGVLTNNIVEGANRVDTTALSKNQLITATQVNPAGIESCRPTTGPRVGGGANPRIRISLSLRQDTNLVTATIGADGGTASSRLKYLGATNVFNSPSYGLAPTGGKVFQPEGCWQTASFLRGADSANPVDPTYGWNNSDGNALRGDYGVLESIAFAIDDLTDTGPFRLYIDNLMNGSVVIQDFESATNGQAAVLFNQPSFSTTTSPFLLAPSPGSIAPDISMVTDEYADTGSRSLLVSWQFKDTFGGDWLRLTAQGSGTPNPIVDLRQPISFRLLLLPVGMTNIPLSFSIQPHHADVMQGSPAELQARACGNPPLSYQWYFNHQPIPGATNNIYSIASAQSQQAGTYYVMVTNASGSLISDYAVLKVETLKYAGMLTPLWALAPGDRSYLTTDGQQSGLAYNPVYGDLLLITRTGGDAIIRLDGNTGADAGFVEWRSDYCVGGLYRFNKIGFTTDGAIYVGNLTTNASVDEFRLYKWYDELSLPWVAWHGNPGGVNDTNRWGDTMDVRDYLVGFQNDGEVLLGSHAGNKVAVLRPAVSDTAAITFTVSNAPSGAFAHGISWGQGDTFWGKSLNGDLYHVGLDFTNGVATVLHVYAGLASLTAIEVDPASQLLGAVSVAAQDALRLLDISSPASGPVLFDARNFPASNRNPNAVAAVAFGHGRLYALDANNGIVCLRIRPTVNASLNGRQLTLRWNGAGALESANEANGTFTEVTGATSPYPVDTSAASRNYFRIRE